MIAGLILDIAKAGLILVSKIVKRLFWRLFFYYLFDIYYITCYNSKMKINFKFK